MVLPAGQVFAVKQRLQTEGLELDVLEFDCARVELKADQAAADGSRVIVGEHFFAIELDDRLGTIEGGLERLPLAGSFGHFLALLPLDEAAGGKWIVRGGYVVV